MTEIYKEGTRLQITNRRTGETFKATFIAKGVYIMDNTYKPNLDIAPISIFISDEYSNIIDIYTNDFIIEKIK